MTLDYRNEYHKVKDLEQLYQKKYVEYLQPAQGEKKR